MKKVFLLILFSIVVIGISAQGYTPKVGETIMFYPLTEKAKQKFKGYDCFYDVTKILPKNRKIVNDVYYDNSSKSKPVSYKFKKGYQFKCDKNGLTPFNEIEGKTFKVLKAESYMHKGKQENKVYLLFLSRIEDNSEIVLRVPFFEKETSELTKNLVCEKIEGYTYKTKYRYVNLPCIPTDYMKKISDKFIGKELYFKWQNDKIDYNYDNYKDKENTLKRVFGSVNKRPLEISKLRNCLDVRFEECDTFIYAHPLVLCSYDENDNSKSTVVIPLTYLAGNTPFYNGRTSDNSNYLFEYLFTLKEKELAFMFSKKNCHWVVRKYTGKDVYYGAKNQYYYKGANDVSSLYNAANNQKIMDNSLYVLSEGIYKCLEFVIYKKPWDTEEVYAVLEDSLGTKFRVPATSIFSGTEKHKDYFYKEHKCKNFQDYFMLVDEAYAYKQEQRNLAIQKAKQEKERYAALVKKYGSTYAEYINGLTTMQREKFERLAPKYGKATAKMMVEEKVRIGWSKQMCREAWGEPDDIKKTIGSWGTHEQWVYGDIYCDYLYFENGVLTSIQN